MGKKEKGKNIEIFIVSLEKSLYFPGDTVRGNVRFYVAHKDIKVKAVTIRPRGTYQTGPQDLEQGKKANVKNEVVIFEDHIELERDNKGFTLPPGEHNFEFDVDLPEYLPESKYFATHNHFVAVKYEIQAELELKSGKQNTTQSFSISNILDLNDRSFDEPAANSGSGTFGSCCFQTKPISIGVEVSKNGFVPGEVVDLSVDISNDSGKHVDLSAVLRQNWMCKISETLELADIITTENFKDTIEGDARLNHSQTLVIPPCPLTTLEKKEKIQVMYEIGIQARLSSASSNTNPIEVFVPIVIGNVPQDRSLDQFVKKRRSSSIEVEMPNYYRDLEKYVHLHEEEMGFEHFVYQSRKY